MAEEGWLHRLRRVLGDKRVVPPVPPGRSAFVPDDDPAPPSSIVRGDESASASVFITYLNTKGEDSQRVITLRRISGAFGQPETLHAHCHMRGTSRSFKVAQIGAMACAESGEELDPIGHCIALHRSGALKIEDIVLTRVMRVLVFMARCDGNFHPLERGALQDVLGRYFRFFGGDDAAYECAISEAPRLAPSSDDVIKALRWLKTAPQRKALAGFTIDASAQMAEADGQILLPEVNCAIEIGDALMRIAGRG